jgi:hypothetical protein
MKHFEAGLLNKEGWFQVRPEVEVKKVGTPAGEETFILCRTTGRKEKEKAIRNRFSTSVEKAWKSLERTVEKGRLKNRDKIHVRLGRIQARPPRATDLYEMEIRETAQGLRLHWKMKEQHQQWREAREGGVSAADQLAGRGCCRAVAEV